MKDRVKTGLWIALLVVGWFWWPAWVILACIVLSDRAEHAWEQLLDAIRGRRQTVTADLTAQTTQDSSELDEEFKRQQECERHIEIVHQQSEYKHISGLPWGDPSSYVKASTPEELEQDERKKLAEAQRQREAQEFLNREAARVIKEREEREERAKVVKKAVMQAKEDPIAQEYRALMELAGEDGCKCGIEGCPGHEAVNGKVFIDNHRQGPIVIDVLNRKPEE